MDQRHKDRDRPAYDKWRPLVCHRLFMDALNDTDIPDSQGVNRRGNRRNIVCSGEVVTDTQKVPYKRSDDRVIMQVSSCRNLARRHVWDGIQWVEAEDDLAAFGEAPKTLLGVGTVALVALLLFK